MTRLSFEHIVRQIQELPSLPAVVLELLSSMDQDDIDVHVLAHKIELDQALAAKTLRIANSSFYGMQSKVTSIPQAVSVLGFHSIRTVVTACALTGSFAPAAGGFDFQAFWRHSLATAIVARLLAPHLRVNPETAFTAGLLHDLGTLVLATRFPAEHALVRSYRQAHDCQMAEAELAVHRHRPRASGQRAGRLLEVSRGDTAGGGRPPRHRPPGGGRLAAGGAHGQRRRPWRSTWPASTTRWCRRCRPRSGAAWRWTSRPGWRCCGKPNTPSMKCRGSCWHEQDRGHGNRRRAGTARHAGTPPGRYHRAVGVFRRPSRWPPSPSTPTTW